MSKTQSQQQLLLETKENNSKSNSKFYNVELKNSPFNVIGERGKYKLVMGDRIVSEKNFRTVKEAIDYVREKPYELILVSAGVFIQRMFEELKKQENERSN